MIPSQWKYWEIIIIDKVKVFGRGHTSCKGNAACLPGTPRGGEAGKYSHGSWHERDFVLKITTRRP